MGQLVQGNDEVVVMLVPDGVRDELELVLARDSSLLGDAYRQQKFDTPLPVAPYPAMLLSVILDGVLPTAATYRARAAARTWKLRENEELSPAAHGYLTALLERLDDVDEPTEVAADVASIYVYSLPSILASPASDDGRRWLKVGFTSGDPRKRVAAQGRQTGLPEDPVLLRIYQGGAVDLTMERVFHRALVAFGHRRQSGEQSGKEWFLTSLVALDALADITGLTVVYTT